MELSGSLLRFESQERLRLWLVWSHLKGATALCHMCDAKETGRSSTCGCVPGCAPGNYTKARGHRKHLCTKIFTKEEFKRSSNTNLEIKGLRQEGQFDLANHSIILANPRYSSPLLTGWSFSSSRHHPSPFPFCPIPRARETTLL